VTSNVPIPPLTPTFMGLGRSSINFWVKDFPSENGCASARAAKPTNTVTKRSCQSVSVSDLTWLTKIAIPTAGATTNPVPVRYELSRVPMPIDKKVVESRKESGTAGKRWERSAAIANGAYIIVTTREHASTHASETEQGVHTSGDTFWSDMTATSIHDSFWISCPLSKNRERFLGADALQGKLAIFKGLGDLVVNGIIIEPNGSSICSSVAIHNSCNSSPPNCSKAHRTRFTTRKNCCSSQIVGP
jgi:hypothetical protein